MWSVAGKFESKWLIMLSRQAYVVSEFCLIGFIYSSLITEELFSSPGAFVHCEIEVSSHCICITGNLRQNIIPNITQTRNRCCFIVSLLAQLSHAQSALFLFSLHCQTFNHKTTQEVLLNGLNLVFWNIFFSNFAALIRQGYSSEAKWHTVRRLLQVKQLSASSARLF